jgi:hypothetical protein
MIEKTQWNNQPVTLSLKPGSLTVSIGQPETATVISSDRAGRLWSVFDSGRSYRRGLNGCIMVKQRDNDGQRQRAWLSEAEADTLLNHTAQTLSDLYTATASDLSAPLHDTLHHAAQFNAARAADDKEAYQRIYHPVGILPPDQYLALVLQVTEGCAFNTCTFCDFYKHRPFHIKTPDKLRHHARAVKQFLGEGLSLRRSIFLGDANALVVPMTKLLPLLDVIHGVYDVAAMRGLHAFLDGFSGTKKTVSDYEILREYGLRRVTIGMESGSAELLSYLRKPGSPSDVVEAVQTIKSAGVNVSVIVLLGAGGHHYADRHVQDTVTALNQMPLGKGDLIYFSELVISHDLPYATEAARDNLQPLSGAERQAQGDAIRAGLMRDVQISRYDIREFIY